MTMNSVSKIKYLLCVAASLLSGGIAHAELSANIPMMQPGEQTEVSVSVGNTPETTAMQFVINLPEGFTIPDGKLTLTERAANHSVEMNAKGDSEYKCVIYSTSNTPFEGTEGTLFKFALQVPSSAISGEYPVVFSGIRFSGTDGNETTAQDVKYMLKVFIPVASIELSANEVEMVRGTSMSITANVMPENATDKKIRWTSDNEEVASVDASGTITAKKVGTTSITATTADGTGLSASCKVTVTPILVASIDLNYSECNMSIGETIKLFADVKPTDADDGSILWSSSNPDVATVTQDGTVTALAKGTAIVSVKANDASGVSTTCIINIGLPAAESVSIAPENITLYAGEIGSLTATVSPAAASQAVIWKCSNTSIASVSEDGKVTAISPGQATITATASDGTDKSATCSVTVLPVLVSSISLDITEKGLSIGESFKLTATVMPENATDKSVTWTSDNTDVATVDQEGIVRAHTIGTAIITVKANDASEVSAICIINVVLPTPEYISISESEISIEVDNSVQLFASVNPADAPQEVVWSSDDTGIATVTDNGIVTGVKEGETKIWAACKEYSSIIGFCLVKVTDTMDVAESSINSIQVYVNQNEIKIEGKDYETIVEITDMEGRIICKSNDSVIRGLDHGVYIVKVGDERIKVRI